MAELTGDGQDARLALLLSGRFDPEPMAAVVERVARRCEDTIEEAALARGDVEARPGTCIIVLTPAGVVIDVGEEPTDFRLLIETIRTGLSEEGVSGRIDLYEPALFRPSETATLIECRVRLAGGLDGPWWRASADAREAAIKFAADWCTAIAHDDAPMTLQVSTTRAAAGRADAALALADAVHREQLGVVSLVSGSHARFRIGALRRSDGGLSLIDGGSDLDGDGWESGYEHVRAQLIDVSSWAVYAFIKRGRRPISATLSGSLVDDWPEVQHVRVLSRPQQRGFEADHALDTFGCQLLTDRHLKKLPDPIPDGWHLTPLGPYAALLEDDDPAHWYSDQMPTWQLWQPPIAPDHLLNARQAFDELLLKQTTVDEHMAQYHRPPV